MEDISPDFGYNSETLIQTPNVDKLASEGVVLFLQNNNDWTRIGKEDYNFVYETDELYDGLDWSVL